MSFVERKMEILEILQEMGGTVAHSVLEERLYISRSTLRRDLIALEDEGIITRHHGGITMNQTSASEGSISMRRMENPEKKFTMARIAEKYIKDNMVIFLDSSSTVSYIVPAINKHKNISIITNGINNASQLYLNENIRCFICPGFVKPKSLSIIGEYTVGFLKEFRADIAFISSKAINKDGIFEGDESQAFCKRAMIKNANQTIMLIDTTKENAQGYVKLVGFDDVDTIISNGYFSRELCDCIEKKGAKLVAWNIDKASK